MIEAQERAYFLHSFASSISKWYIPKTEAQHFGIELYHVCQETQQKYILGPKVHWFRISLMDQCTNEPMSQSEPRHQRDPITISQLAVVQESVIHGERSAS